MNKARNQNLKLIYDVAKWEFMRWFKFKEQVITLVIGVLISLLIFGGKSIFEKFSEKEIHIALINSTELKLNLLEEKRIKIHNKDFSEIELQKKLLAEEKIDAILIVTNKDSAEILVNNKPVWLSKIQEALNSERQKTALQQSNISAEQLLNIFKPVNLELIYSRAQKENAGTGEKFAAGVFIGLMLIGVFIGLAYQFVAITGEKQLRITEVIVSAIKPQTWIDGKILGISFLSLVTLITYTLTSIIFIYVSSLFGSGWSLPLVIVNPVLIFLLFLFSLSGFFFWNTFFSAIAATINDPNTSARGSLIMVPAIPVALGFLALGDPDSLAMKILSVFPLTSAPVISARLVLTEVSYLEIISALALLLLSIFYLRKAAGKIFSLSILLYGKEPSWKEITKWIKYPTQ